jgi:hypothetical protein
MKGLGGSLFLDESPPLNSDPFRTMHVLSLKGQVCPGESFRIVPWQQKLWWLSSADIIAATCESLIVRKKRNVLNGNLSGIISDFLSNISTHPGRESLWEDWSDSLLYLDRFLCRKFRLFRRTWRDTVWCPELRYLQAFLHVTWGSIWQSDSSWVFSL